MTTKQGIMIEDESTLTARFQTTIPKQVRRMLRLERGDKVRYELRPNGEVVIARSETAEEDPVVSAYLDFLARDMTEHPERLQAMPASLAARIGDLVDDVEVELDGDPGEDDD